jgi:transcriptional regulator with XRE-family HTH domain
MQSLKEVRTERGLTIEQTIRALGISRPTYMKYESDPRTMPYGRFLALCEYLGVEPGDIFLPSAVKETKGKEVEVERAAFPDGA